MARLPPSCHAVHRGLRIPDLRAGDDSPLRTSHHHAVPATCRSRRLPTQRLHPCGLNATLRTQSQPCADVSSSRSSRRYHDALAAQRQSSEKRRVQIYDAVVLARISHTPCGLTTRSTTLPQFYPIAVLLTKAKLPQLPVIALLARGPSIIIQ